MNGTPNAAMYGRAASSGKQHQDSSASYTQQIAPNSTRPHGSVGLLGNFNQNGYT